MTACYYEALLPVRELPGDRAGITADLRLPSRVLASVLVPGGRIVVGLVSDSPMLRGMFADNWTAVAADQEPDATLYALARPAHCYGLDEAWDGARWWSRDGRTMIVFGLGSYRLVKVCIRGICSAVSGDDLVFLHGCALIVDTGDASRGVVITGGSGAGKTTLVARLLKRAGYPARVINDDWGAVSLRSGYSAKTGERMLHMKSESVRALRPDFFASALRGSYAHDLSDPDRKARLLVSPESVYGARWSTGGAMIEDVVVIVRESPDWEPPAGRLRQAVSLLRSGGHPGHARHHELFFNGSLILGTASDELREEGRYRRLLDRAAVCWINNCGTPETLAERFVSAVTR